MKKFFFSLQYLLDVCAAKEQAAEYALAAAAKQQADAERHLQALNQRRETRVVVLENTTGQMPRSKFSEQVRGVSLIQRDIEDQRGILEQRIRNTERCRAALQREVMARRVLEKLKERERRTWGEAMQKDDQKQMDETAAARWFRQGEKA
jgi:flagellar export protein FliJ